MSYDLGPSISEFYSALKKEYDFTNFEANEIHQTFKTFVKFIAKGYRYLDEDKMEDGFLHFIIALDLVFGDKQESTKSVGNRCAILTMENTSQFADQKKKITELYDARSRYVHAGLPVKTELVDEVKDICKKITSCFLRLNLYWKSLDKELTVDLWKKKLDYAVAALEANEPINKILNQEIGIKE